MSMDHHCPWINNCVGENNQKTFFLLLVYFCLLFLFSGVTLIQGLIIAASMHPLDYYSIQYVIAIALLGFFAGFDLILLTFHFYLIATNQTTIEHTEINNILGGREEKISSEMRSLLRNLRRDGNFDQLDRSARKKALRVYDTNNVLLNFKQVLGNNLWTWPLPWRK